MTPAEVIDGYVAEVGGRRLAPGEWGLAVDGVEVGLRVVRGLLRAQAWAAPAGAFAPAELLRRNRGMELARYSATGAGEVWVVADAPLDGVDPDRLLGALLEAVLALRA